MDDIGGPEEFMDCFVDECDHVTVQESIDEGAAPWLYSGPLLSVTVSNQRKFRSQLRLAVREHMKSVKLTGDIQRKKERAAERQRQKEEDPAFGLPKTESGQLLKTIIERGYTSGKVRCSDAQTPEAFDAIVSEGCAGKLGKRERAGIRSHLGNCAPLSGAQAMWFQFGNGWVKQGLVGAICRKAGRNVPNNWRCHNMVHKLASTPGMKWLRDE
jgi:hypothetical protein